MKIASTDHKCQHLGTVYRLVEQFELISRTDLAKLSGFAPASMTMLTKTLIDNHFILERTSQNLPSRGRPAVGLAVSSFHWQFLSVTLTTHHISMALCALNGDIIYQYEEPLYPDNYSQLAHYLQRYLQKFVEIYSLDHSRLFAISVSVVGKINAQKTHILQLGTQAVECDVIHTLRQQFEQPILLNEHFQLWLLAESTLGSLIGNDNVIFLQLDDTVNLSVLLKGALLHQDEYKRMNVDKMLTPRFSALSDEIAEHCSDVERYQLANQVTFPALVRLIDRYLPNTLANRQAKMDYFCQQVLQQQPQAMAILTHLTDNLAYILMNLINIFSTERIMLNSPLLQIKQPLFEQIQTKLARNLLLDDLNIDIITSQYDWRSPKIPAVAIKLGIYEGHLLKNAIHL